VRDGFQIVELSYPRLDTSHIKGIDIELTDVRAADGIRVSYDFERDGWVIKQASVFDWPIDEGVFDQDWQEVAFVQAWARKADE
jgi:hypothetical protein